MVKIKINISKCGANVDVLMKCFMQMGGKRKMFGQNVKMLCNFSKMLAQVHRVAQTSSEAETLQKLLPDALDRGKVGPAQTN